MIETGIDVATIITLRQFLRNTNSTEEHQYNGLYQRFFDHVNCVPDISAGIIYFLKRSAPGAISLLEKLHFAVNKTDCVKDVGAGLAEKH